ncbi:hypothetical protein MLD38_008711 [Melastoma candidum]|uniref:Uncharacterized protein n=1 Tax=Melastoma candidum TaxID=119954 RepID=A0ACB9RUX8_9MYRT|nr:hypothetical protein MLD38_008711 [Melastoma candidum]
MKAALRTLESIGALEQFLKKHRKDYVDQHRTTEQERDGIEHEVTAFIKTCKEQIDILQRGVTEEETNSKGWLGLSADGPNADTVAHKQGVVLILSKKLHSVTAQFDQLRAVRFQDAINRATPRRKLNSSAAQLDDETRALQVELTNLLDRPRDGNQDGGDVGIEPPHLDACSSASATIEQLYEQAIRRNSSSRTFILLFFIVLTFSVLFLDWYS